MENVLLSSLILFVLTICGYWLYVLLDSPGKSVLSCLVVSAWSGLLALSLSLLNIHFFLKNFSFSPIVIPLILIFSFFSFIALLLSWKRLFLLSKSHYSLIIFLLAFVAILFISSPFLENKSLTYYFSQNNEFITYAFLSDTERFNNTHITLGITYYRELLISLLCAFFAVLFSKSTFFVVQPLSYSLTWLTFLNFGLLVLAIFFKKKSSCWVKSIGLISYIAALVSPAVQEFWTSSFLSQYYNQAIAIGLIVFLVSTNLVSSIDRVRHVFALGLAFSALQCAYPEQVLPTVFVVIFIYIFFIDKFSWFNFKVRIGILLGALAVAFVVGNRVFYQFLVSYKLGLIFLASPNRIGWDLYGSTANCSLLFANLIGLDNIRLLQHTPTLVIVAFIFLFLLAIVRSLAILFLSAWNRLKVIPLLFTSYLFISSASLAWLYYKNSATNYMAVKFIVAWIWIAYLGIAFNLSTLKNFILRCVGSSCGIIVTVIIFKTAIQYALVLRSDAASARYSELDAKDIQRVIQKRNLLFLFTNSLRSSPLNSTSVLGEFLCFENNISSHIPNLSKKLAIDHLSEINLVFKKSEYENYNFLLILGAGASQWKAEGVKFRQPILIGDGFILFDNNNAKRVV
jgi:hypothetical protein